MCTGPHPYIPAPGVGKFTLIYNDVSGQEQNNLYVHHKDNSAWTDTQLNAMNSTIATAWASNVASTVSTSVILVNMRGTDLTTHTGPSHLGTYSAGGSDATAQLPQGTSYAIKKTTGLRGRSFRGRVFHPGLTDHRTNVDQLTTTYGDAILTGWRAVLTAINAVTNCEEGVLSLCQNGVWLGTGVFTPSVSYDHTDYYIDYQRRRAAAHNRHR